MKKIGKTVLIFIFGVLVAFTIDVAAETLIDSGVVSYSNSKTSETTVDGALDELFSAIDISKQIGSTDISSIGDGTVTGAISTQQSEIEKLNSAISKNDLASGVSIIDYNNSTNPYIAPTDGYITIQCTYESSKGGNIHVLNSNDERITLFTLSTPVSTNTISNNVGSVFVRKGTRVYVEGSGIRFAYFYGLE